MPTIIALVRRIPLRWAELIPRYAIGSIAILWVVQRVAGVPKVLGSINRGPEAGTAKAAFVRPKSNSPIERWIRESCTRMPVLCPRGTQNTELEDEHRSKRFNQINRL